MNAIAENSVHISGQQTQLSVHWDTFSEYRSVCFTRCLEVVTHIVLRPKYC
jgi:hypothetical protein